MSVAQPIDLEPTASEISSVASAAAARLFTLSASPPPINQSTNTNDIEPDISPTDSLTPTPPIHPVPHITTGLHPIEPIPHGENYHTGAVDGNMSHMMRAESTPNLQRMGMGGTGTGTGVGLHTLHGPTSSTSSHPLYPKRFNDDITDHNLSPGILLTQRSQSTHSNPQSPKLLDGMTGNAPTIPQPTTMHHAASMLSLPHHSDLMHLPQSPPLHGHSGGHGHGHGHNHKARFDLSADTGSDLHERDSHVIPENRPVYEKDANGVFTLAGPPTDATNLIRNSSKMSLASLNAPAGAGAGPRAPPVALFSSALATSSVSRATSGDGSFHPHGREKLPYHRIAIDYAAFQPSAELTEIALHVRKCLELRTKFVWTPLREETEYNIFDNPKYTPPSLEAPMPPKANDLHFEFIEGVFCSWVGESDGRESAKQFFAAPNRKEFGMAMGTIMDFATSGPVKTFCHNRLHILEARFNLHELLNHDIEQLVQKSVPHRDFYNVRKIDNHVHHSAAMNQKHLLRFIKAKLKQGSDEIVIIRDGKKLTLTEVFQSLNITAYDLSVDTLDMHADKTFHRFDKFNLKYNPVGESRLREIFLKYNNYIKGKYLAEITQQVFDDLESNKYQFSEYRLSIYGAKPGEWTALADWVVENKLFSANVRWMIQIPRLYSVYRASGQIKNFAEMLNNIFRPLFEVTIDPSSCPALHVFLQSCVGFDMVDDESLRERPFNESLPTPSEWDYEYDPPYALFAYYLYGNICSLNKLRVYRGMTAFAFRPHSGEAGDIEHLAASFLLAKSINHGLMLQKSPALQYLYYLAQIGISMSPLSNNLLFLEYEKNPFPKFFKKGLNVTLSTDDPLMIHVTREPLVEEYSVAGQVWKLSAIDMCEIARNSVLQSGFEQPFKAHYIGNGYWKRSLDGNDIRQTNVPDIRIQFRAELLGDEFRTLQKHARLPFTDALIDRII